ncbi:MAG: tyrosine recombinase [Eubacteriales bacterium]|nr:tyrosine recombinase [Eubacteriales bacterium]
MMDYHQLFIDYLIREKSMAATSLSAYSGDYKEFAAYLADHKGKDIPDATNADVVSYLLNLKAAGRSGATINRKLASIRAFYHFLMQRGEIGEDPTQNIKSPRLPRKKIEFLSIEEVEKLLAQPDQSPKGIRDRALLELMYASGMRVSEIAMANLADLNLRIGFITCTGEHGKARVIPVGRPARAALESYVYEGRKALLRQKEEVGALFLNYLGDRISRQGVWKIIKEYADQAELGSKLSPQILRNSFAAHMIQNGADIKSLQELLGHEDITATQIFMSVSKNRIMDVYDKTHPRA